MGRIMASPLLLMMMMMLVATVFVMAAVSSGTVHAIRLHVEDTSSSELSLTEAAATHDPQDGEERCGRDRRVVNPSTGLFQSCTDVFSDPKQCFCSRNTCCSKWGFCGDNIFYCTISWGCQQPYGRCGPKKEEAAPPQTPVSNLGHVIIKTISAPCPLCDKKSTDDNGNGAGNGLRPDLPTQPKPPALSPPVNAIDEGPPTVCPEDVAPLPCFGANCPNAQGAASKEPTPPGCSPLPRHDKDPLSAAVEAAEIDPYLQRTPQVKLRLVPQSALNPTRPLASSS